MNCNFVNVFLLDLRRTKFLTRWCTFISGRQWTDLLGKLYSLREIKLPWSCKWVTREIYLRMRVNWIAKLLVKKIRMAKRQKSGVPVRSWEHWWDYGGCSFVQVIGCLFQGVIVHEKFWEWVRYELKTLGTMKLNSCDVRSAGLDLKKEMHKQ